MGLEPGLVLFFGAWSPRDLGHYVYLPDGRIDSPLWHQLGHLIDGMIAPRVNEESGWQRSPGTGRRGGEAAQGEYVVARLSAGDRRWTALAFWDRSADGRGASNSAFLGEGEWTAEGLLLAARAAYPDIFARFPFELREHRRAGEGEAP